MRSALAFLLVLRAACDRPGEAPPRDAGPSVDAGGARLSDPGREPRAVTTFAFMPDRREKALLTIDSRLERQGVVVVDEHVEVRLGVHYLQKDTVELTVLGATTTAPDIQRIESVAGTRITQKFYPHGETELPEFSYPKAVDAMAGDYVRGGVAQAASLFLPPVPHEPIGEGARWSFNGMPYSFTERKGARLVIEKRVEMRGPVNIEGHLVETNEEQVYRCEAVTDGIARRIEALLVSENPPGSKRTTRLLFEIDGKP